MKVLIVTARFPFPPAWGAATRDWQLARHLARRHDVTMLCYAEDHQTPLAAVMRWELNDVRTVPLRSTSTLRRRASQLRALTSGEPFTTREERTRRMQVALDETIDAGSFDVVQVESVRMLGAVKMPPGLPVVLDEHNIEYELLQRMSLGERSALRRAFNRAEYTRLRQVERQYWNAVDGCVVTSDREAEIVRSFASTPTVAVPNGVDTDFFVSPTAPPEPDNLVFNGILNYRPNVDAVHYLVEEILPLVRRKRPRCTLTVAGPGEEGLRHLDRPGVRFTGFVRDVRDPLGRAAAVVVPLRIGGGTRLKVVEAFSMGKPVVSSTLGCEGLEVNDGQEVLLGDDAESFAAQVIRVLEDDELRRRLGEAAASLARRRYSWDHCAAALEQHYRTVTSELALSRT